MAHDRKTALLHIGAVKTPLSNVIMQLYLWGDTQTKFHWRKELATFVQEVRDALVVKKGKLKEKDVVEMLEVISRNKTLDQCYRGSLQDPDYSSLVTDKKEPPTSEQVLSLIKELSVLIFTDMTKWEIADRLIELIQTW